jgi:hypothetical protein
MLPKYGISSGSRPGGGGIGAPVDVIVTWPWTRPVKPLNAPTASPTARAASAMNAHRDRAGGVTASRRSAARPRRSRSPNDALVIGSVCQSRRPGTSAAGHHPAGLRVVVPQEDLEAAVVPAGKAISSPGSTRRTGAGP